MALRDKCKSQKIESDSINLSIHETLHHIQCMIVDWY